MIQEILRSDFKNIEVVMAALNMMPVISAKTIILGFVRFWQADTLSTTRQLLRHFKILT